MLMLNDTLTVLKPATLPRRPVRVPQSVESPAPASPRTDGRPLREVALLIESSGAYGRGLLHGIARYNREHGGWSTYFRPHGLCDATPVWLNRWHGDGMLVRIETPEMFAIVRRCGVPVVNLRGTMPGLPFPYVGIDHGQVARLALEHLRECGLQHFAFCGRPDANNPALRERGEHFRALVEADGAVCHVYSAPPVERNHRKSRIDQWHLEQQRLVEWVSSLPRPVGIMACNDERGLQVLDACRRCGARVPEEVAVIGVDNDRAICDLAIPPLSSVDVNAEAVGYQAAAMLDRMMDGAPAPDSPMTLSARGVVVRRSTDLIASDDREVAAALRHIRENACRGLQVLDVLSHLAMSRASLQQRMKRVVGRTIHQEIQHVRLNRVKNLLAMSDLTIKQVARESGFASVQYMTRVFRAVTGETPARYRSCRAR